jgi:beta-glucanase (GH16 family)
MTPNATAFGPAGMVHTTAPAAGTATCRKATVSSGHATWRSTKYGNFTVVASWFDGAEADTNTSIGYIGLDSASNQASITQRFDGAGWAHGRYPWVMCGPHRYQHNLYANNSKATRIDPQYTNTSVSLAGQLNTFGLLWAPDRVVWSLNGEVVRTETTPSLIPAVPMQIRLHTRSEDGNLMPSGSSFQARFSFFSYEPLAT